jgi:hypothetical protein
MVKLKGWILQLAFPMADSFPGPLGQWPCGFREFQISQKGLFHAQGGSFKERFSEAVSRKIGWEIF